MAVREQEFIAVIFRRDGVFFGNAHYLQSGNVHLKATGCAFFGADSASNHARRFLSEAFGFRKEFLANVSFEYDALHRTGTVAERYELQFALACDLLNPSAKRNFSADGLGKVLDVLI
jgi:hypothetical protein